MKKAETALDALIAAENNRAIEARWQDPMVSERIETLLGRLGSRLALVPAEADDNFDEAELDLAA